MLKGDESLEQLLIIENDYKKKRKGCTAPERTLKGSEIQDIDVAIGKMKKQTKGGRRSLLAFHSLGSRRIF